MSSDAQKIVDAAIVAATALFEPIGGGGGGPGGSTTIIMGPQGMDARPAREPLMIPGPAGIGTPGVAGRDGYSIPGIDGRAPREPLMIPGSRGEQGLTGQAGLSVVGPMGMFARDGRTIEPLMIPGSRGSTGLTGSAGPTGANIPGIDGRRGADAIQTGELCISYNNAFGTVTQLTSKSTTVILNARRGEITMVNSALAAATIVSFTLTNLQLLATDVLILNHVTTGTRGAYSLEAQCSAGSAIIYVRNNTAGSLSEAIVIRFKIA